MTPTSIGGEKQASISGGSQSPIWYSLRQDYRGAQLKYVMQLHDAHLATRMPEHSWIYIWSDDIICFLVVESYYMILQPEIEWIHMILTCNCVYLTELYKKSRKFEKSVDSKRLFLYNTDCCGSLVKRLRRRPLTAKTGVRFPYELFKISKK